MSAPLAVILCGGKGTRLKPYTYVLPKPLVPVGERPILLILLEQLKKSGITDVVLCVNYMAELLMSYFGDGSRIGMRISYSMEQQPLGTVAPLKLLRDLPENFLVMNGDLLTDLSFADLFAHHLRHGGLLTVGTYARRVNIDFGVMEIAGERVSGFHEKPEYHFEVSMGVYAFRREVLHFVPEDRPFGFDELMLTLLEAGRPVTPFRYQGYWLDIGRPEDYEKANEDALRLDFCRPS